MTFRTFLTTAAILAGLAAAPGAQPFVWEAGAGHDWSDRVADRVEVVVDRLTDSFEQLAERLSARLDAAADRAGQHVERHVERIRDRVDAHVARHAGAHGAGGDWTGQAANDDPCRENDRWDNDDYRHCEVREQRLPAGPLTVDAGRNGGIRVEGWDGGDILVRAVVQASAANDADARRLASGVATDSLARCPR